MARGEIKALQFADGVVVSAPTEGTVMSDPMTTRGDIPYRNSSNVTARLAVGAAGYIFKSDGTDAAWGPPTFTSPVLIPDGSVTAPGLALSSDADGSGTGLYRIAANTLGFTANGVESGRISSAGAWSIGNSSTPASAYHFAYVANAFGLIASSVTTAGNEAHIGAWGSRTSNGVVGSVEFANYAGTGSATEIGRIDCRRSGANNSGAFDFITRNAGSAVTAGSIAPAGGWTIGPSTSAATLHTMYVAANGTFDVTTDATLTDGQSIAQRVKDNGTTKFQAGINKRTGSSASAAYLSFVSEGGNTNYVWFDGTTMMTSTNSANIGSTTGTVVGTQTSDQRLKQDPRTFDGLPIVMQIVPRDFEWKSKPGVRTRGFYAQELHTVCPEAVSVGDDSVAESGSLANPWGVNYGALTPVLVKAIQELKAELDAAKAEISQLRARA